MDTSKSRLISLNGPQILVADMGSHLERRYPMQRAVPGYGMVMTETQMLAAGSALDGYRVIGLRNVPNLGDIKTALGSTPARIELEDGSGVIQLEDGSGNIALE